MSSGDNEDKSSIKADDLVKELKGSARGRPQTNMNDDSDDDNSDSNDSSKNVKNTYTDDNVDDLLSRDGDGKGKEVSVYKPSSEAAKKILTTSL